MSKEMHDLKERLYKRYGTYCWLCGKKYDKKFLTGHHIIEKSKGGTLTESNIAIACQNCHFGIINHTKYDSEEYWKLMLKMLKFKGEHSR